MGFQSGILESRVRLGVETYLQKPVYGSYAKERPLWLFPQVRGPDAKAARRWIDEILPGFQVTEVVCSRLR